MIELIVTAALFTRDIDYTIPEHYQEYAECVADRESSGSPHAVNPSGKYRGKYQFNDALADGTTYHIKAWVKSWHPKPKKYLAALRDKPMNKWPEAVQDAAFVAVLDGHDAKERWSGMSHFAGGRWYCGKDGR